MKIRKRPQVALIVETSRSYGRSLLRGIAAYARNRTDWALLHQEMTIDTSLPGWMTTSSVRGVIARLDRRNIDPLRAMQVPIVDVRCHERFPGIPQVETDDHLVAGLAFEHLWERGFRRFAFCGYRSAHYSQTRLRFFRERVEQAGCTLSVYESSSRPNLTLTQIEEQGHADIDKMVEWLGKLEPPTGMFVCNDIRGQQVLNACRSLEIPIPDDVAVIGVDDDDAICPLSDPSLSSVKPDAEQVGYRAAEILDAMIRDQSVSLEPHYVPPVGVVQRLSTQVDAVEDREIALACRFIREHACDGIDVNHVARASSLSRRQLERRFRESLGRTPHDEITLAQVSRVKQLLCETSMTLEQIAAATGYRHRERLSTVFKRVTSQTPGSYRRENSLLEGGHGKVGG
ncbi:AraC family transcriptional regulator [Neorhodopirellula pilleata]|uniref:Xylose operon regulatory protein n=1 Tax=Neorhodopirellula pilleata TaxID=2714738 RepID=A0A5C6A805_9BACT|nr:DNA-binding transcriptional regulator [Neorhodopirellula pilleata]TWT95659.1 Xylose operon regulatory protein [Neorhodopirellula pilleata]